ncbi:MAG: hypothetical protein ACTHLT_03470 [Devosia sp.]
MNRLLILSVAAATLIGTAAGAVTAAQAWKTLPRGSGAPIDQFKSDMSVYNKQDIADLLAAKTVSVINYGNAWAGQKGSGEATNLLTDEAQAINLLREGLAADPAAVKLLAEHKIKVDQVVAILSDGNGNVQLYVS